VPWPEDLWGELREMRQLGNGKLLLTVAPSSAKGEVRHVRGFSPNPERHPALQHLKVGDRVGLFNLQSASGGATLTESSWTIAYKMSKIGVDDQQ
jgi:hypothetical protein